MPVSFGIEFEFDYITSRNRVVTRDGSYPSYLAPNWDYQSDPTATCELRSPVFQDLNEYIEECNAEFNGIMENDGDRVPYMCNSRGRSLGQHLHIGLYGRRLRRQTKERVARVILGFYPLMASLQAQPIPSNRGLTTIYARSMSHYRDVISTDHYAEISSSHLGTIELRIFDSNIPQASLVNAWISTSIANRVLRSRRSSSNDPIDWEDYEDKRTKALRYGLVGIDITEYLRRLRDVLGNVELPNITCVREILYLMARYRLNPYGVWKYSNVKAYRYMREELRDCSKFLENLLRVGNVRHRDQIEQWIEEARLIESLDQLIGLSIGVDRSLAESLGERIAERLEAQPSRVERRLLGIRTQMGRSEVRNAIEEHNYYIARIHDVAGYTSEEVAERISSLLRLHGDGNVNVLDAREVIETPFRFYVFVAYDRRGNSMEICGAISVHVRSGEIASLVVDRRFRRLGIARRLVDRVLGVLDDEESEGAFVWVRKANGISSRLFERMGFRETERSDRAVRMSMRFER